MTLRYLLDTSIVSVPMSKTPNPQLITRLDEHGHESAIAAPVWHELTYGCRRLPKGKRRDVLESYLHDVVQASFPIDLSDAGTITPDAGPSNRDGGVDPPMKPKGCGCAAVEGPLGLLAALFVSFPIDNRWFRGASG